MASPDGLRLYFGKYSSLDVNGLIFQYGFHLWLAKPRDAYMGYAKGFIGHRELSYRRWTTIRVVHSLELTSYARHVVDYWKYYDEVCDGAQVYEPARPMVFELRYRNIPNGEWYHTNGGFRALL